LTTAQQLGNQLRTARLDARLSLRKLGAKVSIPATTIEGYEAGNRIPADKFLRLADALNHQTFEVDGYKFNVTRSDVETPKGGEQLNLNFSGEYLYSRATVKISPGRITVAFDANRLSLVQKKS